MPDPPKPSGGYSHVTEERADLRTARRPPPPSDPHHAPVRVERGADPPTGLTGFPTAAWQKIGGQRAAVIAAYAVLVGAFFKGAVELLETWNAPQHRAQIKAMGSRVQKLERRSREIEAYLRLEHTTSQRQHEYLGAAICKALGGPPHTTFPCGQRSRLDPEWEVTWMARPLDADNRPTMVPQAQQSWPLHGPPKFNDVALLPGE